MTTALLESLHPDLGVQFALDVQVTGDESLVDLLGMQQQTKKRIKVNFLYSWPWITCHGIKKKEKRDGVYQEEDEKPFFLLLLELAILLSCHGNATGARHAGAHHIIAKFSRLS